ncbi:type I-F CRISPR-associated protein Csy1 [Sansalvadorimonas verongulae]|uniref:type I-F CRISPR-associated protein Csy1 n=1 Tax=Sansalvadorimonas verongulae TaxID=2172824 RepID=UPI0018AD1E8F|nr:type I-F CRISPR-associated protein Csy1 [Sansalvadorimonas verongulae]
MGEVTHESVVRAITQFLDDQLQTKLEPLQKKLGKASPDSDQTRKLEEEISTLKGRFSKLVWMEQAGAKMAKQLRFGSHISKGIHPDSKGDNINFRPTHSLPAGIVGFQNIAQPELDANGNAAALPLAAFFNSEVDGVKLRDLILADHPALEGAFDSDPEISRGYQKAFKEALEGVVDTPSADGFNKQVLWPLEDAVANDDYRCLVPLYPSALTNKTVQAINERRFNVENKEARDNRRKSNVNHKPYVSIHALAATQLGGTKPQNVSSLTSRQRGRNLLLESLPPTYSQQHEFRLSKRENSFFNRNLVYHCYQGLQMLYAVVEAPKSVMEVRDQRKQALDLILGQILQAAAYIQTHYPAGWSESYKLKMPHKYWLDPRRADQELQESFKEGRENTEWVSEVMKDFSLWINTQLKTKFPKQSTGFDDAEQREWLREAESAVKASIRAQEGIF